MAVEQPASHVRGKPPRVLDRAQKKKLKKTRREARDFLREARRLVRRAGKRLAPDKRLQIEETMAALGQAMRGDDVEHLGAILKRLDAQVDKHLAFARRHPALEYSLSSAKYLAIALLLRFFVIEPFKIPSGSMIPTLLIGDQIFVNKLSYGVRLPVINGLPLHWGGYRRGDVVVFVNPNDDALPLFDRRDYIKRIVGLPGDVVEVRDEVVYVNGVAQPREKVQDRFGYYDRLGDDGPWFPAQAELYKETMLGPDGKPTVTHDVLRDPTRPHHAAEGPFKVPPGHLFMLGDNRDNSQDGRSLGGWYVPFDHVKGRALVIWLSWGKPGWGPDGVGLRGARFGDVVR